MDVNVHVAGADHHHHTKSAEIVEVTGTGIGTTEEAEKGIETTEIETHTGVGTTDIRTVDVTSTLVPREGGGAGVQGTETAVDHAH